MVNTCARARLEGKFAKLKWDGDPNLLNLALLNGHEWRKLYSRRGRICSDLEGERNGTEVRADATAVVSNRTHAHQRQPDAVFEIQTPYFS